MSEVYCKNCKRLVGVFWCEYYDHIQAWTGAVKELIKKKMGTSQDCSNYQRKRKWWEFWVKEE